MTADVERDLLVYSGVQDKGVEFGNDRLLDWANRCRRFSNKKSLVDNLNSTVKAFAGDAEQGYDITILSVKFRQHSGFCALSPDQVSDNQ